MGVLEKRDEVVDGDIGSSDGLGRAVFAGGCMHDGVCVVVLVLVLVVG